MAQAPYDRQYNFTNWQAAHPDEPLPAGEVDAELNAVKIALNGTQEDLALIQKTDGSLANGVVDVQNLASGLVLGFTLKGSWAVGTAYVARDVVVYFADFYVCKTAHTSTAATPDTLTGTWEFLFDASALIGGIGVADGSITEVKLATGAVTVNKIGTDAVITTKIGAGAVTNAKLANVAASTIKGRFSAGTGAPEDLTVAQVRALLALTDPVGVVANHGVSASAAAGALTINLTDAAGSSPSAGSAVSIPFRSATEATGTMMQRSVTASNSLVISSGSTLGVSAINTAFALWLVAFDDGGTIRLGIMNCLSGSNIYPLGGYMVASSTAEGGAGAADSAHVFYSGTAVTAKAYCPIARLEWSSGLSTLGTWTAPSRIDLCRDGMKLPGDVIQLRQVVKSDTFTSTTTGALTDITGLSLAITPTSAANMVRAIPRVQTQTDTGGNAASFALIRGSVNIGGGVAAGNRPSAFGGVQRTTDSNSITSVTAVILDAPNAAASTTYKVQFSLQAGTLYVNRTSSDSDIASIGRYSSSITLEEIQT